MTQVVWLFGSEELELVRVDRGAEGLGAEPRTARLRVNEPSIKHLLKEDLQKLVLVRNIGMAGNLRIREKLGTILHADRRPSCSCMEGLREPSRQNGKDRIYVGRVRMHAEMAYMLKNHLLR